MRWRHNETLASRATARCSGCFHQYGVYATSLYAAATRLTSTACANCRSPELAAVIGSEAVARTQVIKKLWDYIKEHGLQDAKDKRSINADAKLLAVFGKPQVTMFELAGIAGKHLSA